MRLLPRDTLLIESPLSAPEALARLYAATGPWKLFRLGRVPYTLEGTVNADRVNVQRVIYYRNSFLPRIRAVVEPAPRGSRLRGTLSLHPLVIAFLVVWFGALLAVAGFVVLSAFRGELRDAFMILPFVIIALVWLLIVGAFSYEANRARRLLADLLAAESAAPVPETARR